MSPELDITQDGRNFSIKLHSLHLTKESNFAVNEEFEEVHFISGAIMKVCSLCECCQSKRMVKIFLLMLILNFLIMLSQLSSPLHHFDVVLVFW